MSTYIAAITFEGTDYFLPYDEHEWIVQGGFYAPVQGWVMPKTTCDAILAALGSSTGIDREVALQLGDPDDPIYVSRVIVLGSAPADNPQRRTLLLTDVRWYFTRAWMCMDVNVKRRMGDTRLIGGVLETLSFDSEIADTIEYAPWSINNGAPYEWTDLKEQVLAYLTTAKHGRPEIFFSTDTFTVLTLDDKIVEKTITDAPGHVALANAIQSIPGASIYVALDGAIHVYETTPGAETTAVAALPAALQGHGDIQLVDKSALRPEGTDGRWRVYVDWEVELRLTYNMSGSGLWNTLSANDPFLLPVLQVTDQSLTIPAAAYPGGIDRTGLSSTLRTVGQGSWITQAEAFAAWGGKTYGSLTLPTLTDDIVARHYLGDSLQRYCVGQTIATHDPVWTNRIQELMRCYRTFFRVNPKFWDKVRHAWAIRAAIWDPVTGQRAPASCYANFRLIPVERFASPEIAVFGVNVTTSYPSGAHEGLLAYGTPNGFHVRIVDKELGIIAIDRNALSKYPGHAKITLSPVTSASEADLGPTGLLEPALEHLVSATSGSDAWKLAVVISVSPAAPNDLRRLYEIPVTMEEAALTAGMTGSPPTGYGPDKEMRSHLSQARVAWLDDTGTYDEILRLLGCSDSTIAIDRDNETAPIALTPINLEQELKPLARAIAAADLVSKLDCFEGRRAVPMDDEIVPIGTIKRVTHKVVENRAISIVECANEAEPFSAIDFLEVSSRAYLLQELKAAKR